MAKDKKSKSHKAAARGAKVPQKGKPTKLPKEIGGIAIPKTLRKEGGALVDLMRHPLVAELVTAGLAALTIAVRDSGKPKSVEPDGDEAPKSAAPKSAIDFGQGAAILGTMIAAKAIEGLKKR